MRKKVLILIPSLEIGGGAEKVASSITQKLSKNYEIFILTFFHSKSLYPFKGKYYSLKENLYFGRLLFRFFKIYKFIRIISPDIIISFLAYTNFYAVITKALFKIKIPLIVAVRNNPNLKYKDKQKFSKFLIKLIYPLKIVNGIVTVSKELQKILITDYKIDKNKIVTIYNGIDLERINRLEKENSINYEEIFNNPNIIKFIAIGSLLEKKGFNFLIKAFAKVFKEIPNSILFILGEGPLRIQLERLIKINKLEENVILLGKKNNPYKYLSRANIFVLSSIYEGFPNVLIEAMACSLPVISTMCKTGPKEILKNGKFGILTKVKDSNDLAEKMIFLAKNKNAREDFSKRSIQRIKSFELEKIIIDWDNLIKKYSL